MKTIFITLFFSILYFSSFSTNKLVAKVKVEKMVNGKLIVLKSMIFIDFEKNKFITEYTEPEQSIVFSNTKGEAKMYFPKTKKVVSQQNSMLSSSADVLYFLLTTKEYDLGLKSEGCKLLETKYEEGVTVTLWEPPAHKKKHIKQIKLVYKNETPIYTEYINHKDKKIKETYYYNYQIINNYPVPTKITEYVYLKKGQKIVSRKTYSDIKTGTNAEHNMFNFEIPESTSSSKK